MSKLHTFRDVIDLWRTRAALARLIQAKEGKVRSWHARDSIPEPYFLRIVEAANTCGFEGVTYALLNTMLSGAALMDDEPI